MVCLLFLCMLFKYFRLNPWCVPLWTLTWHSLHKGTCFLLILASILLKVFSLVLIVFMCFKWCISIFEDDPQFTHSSPMLEMVDIFQSLALNGSSYFFMVILKFMGFLTKSLNSNCWVLIIPFVFFFMETFLPHFVLTTFQLSLYFLLMVIFKLPIKIQYILLKR